MPEPDRAMGNRLHAIIKASAPALSPKLWYRMPAYTKCGKVVCFLQSAQKFKTRYASLGFNDVANLDEGVMWPIAFALKKLTAAEEAKSDALVKKAVSWGLSSALCSGYKRKNTLGHSVLHSTYTKPFDGIAEWLQSFDWLRWSRGGHPRTSS